MAVMYIVNLAKHSRKEVNKHSYIQTSKQIGKSYLKYNQLR